MPSTPIQTPSSYISSHAAAFADGEGAAVLVSAASPLPVAFGAPAATPLAGSTAASGIFGPYAPALGRAVMLSLGGTWAGAVKVLRSADGGATKVPLTLGGQPWGQFTGNCCEPVWDESEGAARLYLDVALTSGTCTYRFAQ